MITDKKGFDVDEQPVEAASVEGVSETDAAFDSIREAWKIARGIGELAQPTPSQGSGERELPPRPETCNEIVLDYMDTLEAKLKAALAANAAEYEWPDLDLIRSKVLDVMHTLSVMRDGKAHNPDLSAGACYTVLDQVLKLLLRQYRALKSREK